MDHNNTMEYRIGLEKQNKRNDQVTELILDNCRASQISGLTEEFVNLETLSLINVGLTTLKGFPKLPKLKKLEISDNRLTGGLNLLHGSPNLQHLNISGNRIKDFDALEPLKEFHDLVSLDLYNCEVTKVEDYRKKVFDLLPNLKALDGYDREEREVADSDEDDEETSDVENHITRDDNESDDEEEAVDDDDDDDDDDDGEDDDDDDDDGSYDESYGEMEGDYHPKGQVDPRPEVSDEEEEDYDEDDDDEDDDDDDDMADEEEDIEQNSNGDLAAASSEHNPISNNNSAVEQNDLDGGVDDDVQEIVDESHDGGEDGDENGGEDMGDEEEEEEDDDEDADADLKLLQKDSIVEDDDDADFEPTHEPDERDHEIDPEDDADEDNADGDTTGQLSSSKLDTTTTETIEADVADKRGQKRKLEDEGGDEVESETAQSGQE